MAAGSCSVHGACYDVANYLSTLYPDITVDVANKLINEVVEAGLITFEDAQGSNIDHLLLAIMDHLNSGADVDVEFEALDSGLAISGVEGFAGDKVRSSYANAYIGVNAAKQKGVAYEKPKNYDAFRRAGRTIIDDDTEVDEGTVAYAEIYSNSSAAKTVALISKVLDAGGRVLMPSASEITSYARKSKAKTKADYEKVYNQIYNALISQGYSCRQSASPLATVWERTVRHTYQRLDFSKDRKGNKIKKVADISDEEAAKVKKQAKPWSISASSLFKDKEGADTKDESVTQASSLYEAIVDGDVTSIARTDTENNKYSSLKKDDVIMLKRGNKTKDVVYVKVTSVTPNVNRDKLVRMMENGDVQTGYTVDSAKSMDSDKTMTVVSFEVQITDKAEAKKSSRKKKSSSKGKGKGKGKTIKVPRLVRDKHGKTKIIYEEVSAEPSGDAKLDKATQMNIEYQKQMVALQKLLVEKLTGERITVEKARESVLAGSPIAADLESSDLEKKKAAQKEVGYQNDVDVEFGPVHTFTGDLAERDDKLSELFNGDSRKASQFAYSVATYLRHLAVESVIPKMIRKYEEIVDDIDQHLAEGLNMQGEPMTDRERKEMLLTHRNLVKNIDALKADGWIAACRIKDVMTETLYALNDSFYKARLLKRSLAELAKKQGKDVDALSDEEVIEMLNKDMQTRGKRRKVTDLRHFDIFLSDRKHDFLSRLYDCFDAETTEQKIQDLQDQLTEVNGQYLQNTTDVELAQKRIELQRQLDTYNNRTEEQITQDANRDARIEYRDKEATILRRVMFNRACDALSALSGVRVSTAHVFKDNMDDADLSDEYERNEEAEDEDDMEGYEHARDEAFFSAHERAPHETMSTEIKRILGSIDDWYYDEGTGRFWIDVDGYFGVERTLSFGVIYNNLLALFTDTHHYKGFKSSSDFYAYLASNEKQVGWYHGLILAMDADPTLQTKLFNAFAKSKEHFTQVVSTSQLNDFYNWKTAKDGGNSKSYKFKVVALNFDQNAESVIGDIQANISKGSVLTPSMSIYNSRGEINKEGVKKTLDFLRDKNKRLILKAAGINNIESYAKIHPEIIDDFVKLFNAVGVSCNRDSLVFAFSKYPDLLFDAVGGVKVILEDADRNNVKGSVFDFYDNYFKDLGKNLKGLSTNKVEKTFRFANKQMSSYANPCFVNEIVNELGDEMNDDEVAAYIEENFLQSEDADSSFYMIKDDDGKVEILDPFIRDLMPNEALGKPHQDNSRAMRKLFRLGKADNLGMDDEKYNRLSTAQRVAIDFLKYFTPTFDGVEKMGSPFSIKGMGIAQYAIPIMADKTRHIAFGMPRFYSGFSSTNSDLFRGGLRGELSQLTSHKPGFLLDRLADVTIQEYHRIKMYASADEETRRRMPKEIEKKKDKFCFLSQLNDVRVVINNEAITVVGMIERLASEELDENDVESVSILYNGQTFNVEPDSRQPLHKNILMSAIQRCALNEMFTNDMNYWQSEGVFSISDDDWDFLSSENNSFKEAYSQYKERKDAWWSLSKAMFKGYIKYAVVDNGDGTSHLEPVVQRQSQDDLSTLESKTNLWFDLALIPGAQEYLFSLSDIRYNEFMYGLNNDERNEMIKQQAELRSQIIDLLEEYKKSDPESAKVYDAMISVLETKKDSSNWTNKLVAQMQEYSFNAVLANIEMFQLFHGDPAQFGNIVQYSKREQAVVATHDSLDTDAIDVWNSPKDEKGKITEPRKFIDYYGDKKIEDSKWIKHQKVIYLKDFESRREDGSNRTTGFYNISQYFNEQLLPNLEALYSAGVLTRQEFMEYCDAYAGMTITDGQAFRMPHSTRKLLGMSGAWNDRLDTIFKAIENGQAVSFADVSYTMQQLKTVLFDHESVPVEYSDGEGNTKTYMQKLSVYLKQSEFGLLLHSDMMADYLGQDSFLRGVVDFCIENQVDTVNFNSCVKVGSTNSVDLTNCKTRQEAKDALNAALAEGRANPNRSIFHALKWTAIGRQQSTPEHLIDKDNGMGIQARKILQQSIAKTFQGAVIDRDESGNPKTYTDEYGNTKIKYKKATFDTRITIRDDNDQLLSRKTPQEFKSDYDRLLITKMRRDWMEVEKRFSNKREISKLLIEALDATDQYADDVRYGLQYNPITEDFNIPLDHPVMLRAVAPILSSIVRKRVIKQKTAGGTAFQFSSVGLTENLKVVTDVDEVTGQPRLKYAEVKLPAWTRKLFEGYADENGDIDINKIPAKYLQMIGYRMPTEHLYSILPMRVVGFLEPYQGSSIMLPQEIVIWSGSDFDIDKLYIEMPSFHIQTTEEYTNTRKENMKAFLKEYDKWNELIEQKWEEAHKADTSAPVSFKDNNAKWAWREQWWQKKIQSEGLGRKIGNRHVALTDILSTKEKNDFHRDFNHFLDSRGFHSTDSTVVMDELPVNFTQEDLDNASDEALDNAIIRLHWARMTSDFTYPMFNYPQGFAIAKRASRRITLLLNSDISYEDILQLTDDELAEKTDKFDSAMGMFQASGNHQLFKRNMVGKAMIGVSALHNSFHQILQEAPLHFSPDAIARLGFYINGKFMTGSGENIVGSIFSEDGRDVCFNIANFLGASVDNAKDPILEKLNYTPETASIWTTLLHLGFSIETAALFMTQPIVLRAYEAWRQQPETTFTSFLYDEINKTTSVNEANQIPETTRLDMANAIRELKGMDYQSLKMEPQQLDILKILFRVAQISNVLDASMSASKVDSPKNSMGNTFGLTYTRSNQARRLLEINNMKLYANYKKVDEFDVFELDDIASFIDPDFDSSTNEPRSVDDYVSGRTRLPFQQACYDFGLARPIKLLSPYIKSWGGDLALALNGLNDMMKNKFMYSLKADTVDAFVREFKFFRTAKLVVHEMMEDTSDERSFSERRQAWLASFPEYLTSLISNYKKYGLDHEPAPGEPQGKPRNLEQEYPCLRNIVAENNRKGNRTGVLKLSKAGRVDKNTQNDFINAWLNLASDSEDAVRELAIQLYKYSMFFNGCEFTQTSFGAMTPCSIVREFPAYLEELRKLDQVSTSDYINRFVDQFVRNHWQNNKLGEKVSKRLTPKFIKSSSMSDLIPEVAHWDKENQRWVFNDEFTYSKFKDETARAAYLLIGVENNHRTEYELYRKDVDSHGKTKYTRVDFLGSEAEHLFEYDPDVDIKSAASLDYSSIGTKDALKHNHLKDMSANALATAQRQEYQRQVLLKLAATLQSVSRSYAEGVEKSAGNNSTGYTIDAKGTQAIRVHSFLGIDKTLEKPSGWDQWSWDDNIKKAQNLGTAVDSYARAYFSRRFGDNPTSNELSDQEAASILEAEAEASLLLKDSDINWDSTESKSLQEAVNKALEEYCEYTLEPGDRVITALNGKNITVFGNVKPIEGKKTAVAGELDLLVAHKDGTFSIVDIKTCNREKYGNIKNDTYGQYTDWCKQVNCYRVLLESMFPGIEIRDTSILPIVYEQRILEASGRAVNKQNKGREEGSGQVFSIRRIIRHQPLNITLDDKLSGIKTSKRKTVVQEQKEEQDISDAELYATIISNYLGEEALEKEDWKRLINDLSSDNDVIINARLSGLRKVAIGQDQTRIAQYVKGVSGFENASDEFIEKLAVAIEQRNPVVDDDDIELCK